ncbi:hypothetical protein [Companilactobacillus versmoldensis]|uniref:DUF1659 domain-containing protein n=1 Tax=Companilactobacillus versmoldensis DSM 14857 = KCTC 3814 TaxID=1423815 RepID=A0A0R1SLY2_9LACO|nr:hypothetical protein [Companilactobacillus versmoldensis]KRL67016.1 hypothetical protein FC27_GL002130 [Companilactobacillus versmoldensis DSM 14857 = KCTC 3814]
MDWEKTSVKITLQNKEKYGDKKIHVAFNDIGSNPEVTQINLFIAGITDLLEEGTTITNVEVLKIEKLAK